MNLIKERKVWRGLQKQIQDMSLHNELSAAFQMAIGNYFALRRSYGDNFIYYIEQNI